MAFALFRNESDQRINCPIRTNTQRFCLARAVHYQPAPHHPGTRQEPLPYALNFDITEWQPITSDDKKQFGHQWPRYWYDQSVTRPEYRFGYHLSLEGGGN